MAIKPDLYGKIPREWENPTPVKGGKVTHTEFYENESSYNHLTDGRAPKNQEVRYCL